MRYRLLFFLMLCKGIIFAQNVSNVQFKQEGNRVKITYTLDKKADISVSVSTDGGKTFSKPLKEVAGDCGSNVGAGNKTIYWDVIAEYGGISGHNLSFRVLATNSEVQPSPSNYSTPSKDQKPNLPKKKTFKVNGCSFTMILVEGGTFDMGTPVERGGKDDEHPVHSVKLDSYYIAEYEVSVRLWYAVVKGSTKFAYSGSQYGISWNAGNEFIKKLNQLTGEKFRMPTEAEWEFAARGGNKSKGYIYSGSNFIKDVAWFGHSIEVKSGGKKKSNELGIYDMSGNVWEWCSDWYGPYKSNDQQNPQGALEGNERVLRGGSVWYDATSCRVFTRESEKPNISNLPSGLSAPVGLRLVLSY